MICTCIKVEGRRECFISFPLYLCKSPSSPTPLPPHPPPHTHTPTLCYSHAPAPVLENVNKIHSRLTSYQWKHEHFIQSHICFKAGSIYCMSGPILAFILAALPMYDIRHCQPVSTPTQFRDAYLMSHKLGDEFPPKHRRRRMEDGVIVLVWCFDTVMTHVLQSTLSPFHSEEWTCPLLQERNGPLGHYQLLPWGT